MRDRTAWWVTAAIAAFGGVLVWIVSTEVFPYHSLNHDEAVYLQQAAMLLDGQLHLRPPVEGAFRPWFFVEDGRRLYPKYAPVPAVFFALGGALGSYRLALVGVAIGIVALTIRVTTEAFDRRTGLVAGLFLLASPLFLLDAAVFLPYAPTALLDLAFALAYLRADRTDDLRWAAFAGGAIGLAFFARPYTAILFAVPFGVHALWTLRSGDRTVFYRHGTTAAFGLGGVALALAYNAAVTGSPWLFPYEAFAPLDGLGFGRRRILGHEVTYSPALAVRANAEVVELLFSEWIAGGLLGAVLVGLGLGVVARRGPSASQLVVAGLFVSIVAGNVYFWGNYNILGDLERPGDGLVAVLGPYYHFDVLLPTAAFAARGATVGFDAVNRWVRTRFDGRRARVFLAVLVVTSTCVAGFATVGTVTEPLERNLDATATYERTYQPFEGDPPENSLVFLPTPYGDWLNHPFQPLRNEPGFDGDVVYAIDEQPFAIVDEYRERRYYRYTLRGPWSPVEGVPEVAHLQRVREVSGSRVLLDTTVGVPSGALGTTVRLGVAGESAYYATENATGDVDLRLSVEPDGVELDGDLRPVGDGTIDVYGRETLRVTVFVDYGQAGGLSYRFDVPIAVGDDTVRALTPRVEWCRDSRICGGAAAYVPEDAPDDVFVRPSLTASNASAMSAEG